MIRAKSFKPGTADWLHQAIAISLFTNARSENVDTIPVTDWQGHWGDVFLPEQESLGSLLWTLNREKMTDSLVVRARNMIRESVQWLIDERWLLGVDVTVWRDADRLYFRTRCSVPDGTVLDDNWETTIDEL